MIDIKDTEAYTLNKEGRELDAPGPKEIVNEQQSTTPLILTFSDLNATTEKTLMSDATMILSETHVQYDASSAQPFLKMMRSPLFIELMRNPHAFTLLAIIAYRAKRADCPITKLKAGEALIGDYESYGMTRRQYRTASTFLKARQITTIQATNRGTIAKLTDSSYYDINLEDDGQQKGQQTASKRPTERPLTRSIKKERMKEEIDANASCSKPRKTRYRADDKLVFDFESGTFTGIEKADRDLWTQAYPGADIAKELAKSIAWLKANPAKAQGRTLWRKFISNWLSRASEQALQQEARKAQYNIGKPQVVDRRQLNADGTPVENSYAGVF